MRDGAESPPRARRPTLLVLAKTRTQDLGFFFLSAFSLSPRPSGLAQSVSVFLRLFLPDRSRVPFLSLSTLSLFPRCPSASKLINSTYKHWRRFTFILFCQRLVLLGGWLLLVLLVLLLLYVLTVCAFLSYMIVSG